MYRTDHDNVYESGKLIEEGSGYRMPGCRSLSATILHTKSIVHSVCSVTSLTDAGILPLGFI